MVSSFIGFVLACVALVGSPGPSTMSVTAVGATVGWRRALGYTAVVTAGTWAVLALVAAGLVGALTTLPWLFPALAGLGIIYICYLAIKIACAPPLGAARARVDGQQVRVSLVGGFTLAVANPKAYLALGAVFAGTRLEGLSASADVTVRLTTMVLLTALSHFAWMFVGSSAAGLFRTERAGRAFNLVLAVALLASCVMLLPTLAKGA